jgi:hypothetical protein
VASGTLRPLAAVDLISSRRGLSTSRSRSCTNDREVTQPELTDAAVGTRSIERDNHAMQHAQHTSKAHGDSHLLIVDLQQLHPHSVHSLQ